MLAGSSLCSCAVGENHETGWTKAVQATCWEECKRNTSSLLKLHQRQHRQHQSHSFLASSNMRTASRHCVPHYRCLRQLSTSWAEIHLRTSNVQKHECRTQIWKLCNTSREFVKKDTRISNKAAAKIDHIKEYPMSQCPNVQCPNVHGI